MKDLAGKVAVITGAGSGMGRAMVRKAASEGMHVLAGDIDEAGLAETVGGLENAQLMLTDVTSAGRQRGTGQRRLGAIRRHPPGAPQRRGPDRRVHLGEHRRRLALGAGRELVGRDPRSAQLCAPDAGGGRARSRGDHRLGRWAHLRWAARAPTPPRSMGPVAIAESLYRELDIIGAPIGVSCLCPGAVATGIFRAERNRPDTYEDTCGPMSADAEAAAFHKALINAIDEGTDPTEIPELVFDAVRSDKFWIFPHPEFKERIADRTQSIINETNPEYAVGLPSVQMPSR